jgi:ech hydrogenase subunit F
MPVFKMAKTVLGSLLKKPATLMYPVIARQYGEKTRGHIVNDIDNCIFCGMCSRKCPAHAIEVNKAEKLWAIERLCCIQCNCCVEVCPKQCLNMENTYTSPAIGSIRDVFQDARVPDHPADR